LQGERIILVSSVAISKNSFAVFDKTLELVCGFISQGPASRPFYGCHALLASTSLSTSSNGAAVGGAALAKPDRTEAQRKVHYSFEVSVNSAAVWGVCGVLMCGLGVWLRSPQIMAQLGKDSIIGSIALVIGVLGIYKGDMDKLESKMDKLESNLMTKLNAMSGTLQGLEEDRAVRKAVNDERATNSKKK
jgi:hypothetical protein